MVGLLTILWSELSDLGLQQLRDATGPSQYAVERIHVERVLLDDLEGVAAIAIQRGAVVFIADGGRDASLALSVGVDEVVRAGEIGTAVLRHAIDRALERAWGRSQRAAQRRGRDAATFSLLAAALGNELGASLTVASTCCEMLSSGLPSMMQVNGEVMDLALATAPLERMRHLVAASSACPNALELTSTASDARQSVAHALSLVRTLRELSFDDGHAGVVLDDSLNELGEMLRTYLSSWADLKIEAESGAVALVSRSAFTWIMSTMLGWALESIRGGGDQRGVITIVARDEHECVTVEVSHDVAPLPASMMSISEDMHAVRAQAQALGGELLLEDTTEPITARLMLPKGSVNDVAPRARSGWVHFSDDARSRQS